VDRALLTAAVLGAVAVLYLLMLRGWRGRQRRQADLPPPPVPPAVPGRSVVSAVPGLFVGTTFAGDWLDRVAVHDLAHRAAGFLRLDSDGVHVEREGLPELYLPYEDVERAALGDALAGKVIGKDGLLVLDWRLGEHLLTSGFRADDPRVHRRLADAVTAHLPTSAGPARPAPPDREAPS
jgi:hypothetical protein